MCLSLAIRVLIRDLLILRLTTLCSPQPWTSEPRHNYPNVVVQGVATSAYLQRQGNATRLVKQLELVLADAGVQELAVILEPQVGLVATEFNIDWWCVHVFVANVKIPLPVRANGTAHVHRKTKLFVMGGGADCAVVTGWSPWHQ